MPPVLSPLGQLNYHRNQIGSYSCFIVGAELNLSANDLNPLIGQLISQRPLLRRSVSCAGELIELNSLIVDDTILVSETYDSIDSLQGLLPRLNQLHDTTFPLGKPLWKLVVINSKWCFVLCDHILYDGNTACYTLEDLWKLSQGIQLGESDDDSYSQRLTNLITPSYWYIIKNLYKELIGNRPILIPLPKDTSTFHTLQHLITLNSTDITNLKSVSKAQQVKFTSILTHLCFNCSPFEKSSLGIPINLRKFIGSGEPYGLYVSEIDIQSRKYSQIQWDEVRRIDTSLNTSDQRESAKLIYLLNYVNIKKYLLDKVTKPRMKTFEISNLGHRSKTWNEFIFSQPNNHSGCLITINVISSDTKTNILICGAPETLEIFQDFATNFESQLRSLI